MNPDEKVSSIVQGVKQLSDLMIRRIRSGDPVPDEIQYQFANLISNASQRIEQLQQAAQGPLVSQATMRKRVDEAFQEELQTLDDVPKAPLCQNADRLISLIEFAQESAKLKHVAVGNAKNHPFCAFEHELRGLPGVFFDGGSEEKGVWLTIERLHETTAPRPPDMLTSWLDISDDPNHKPELKVAINVCGVTQNRASERNLMACDSDVLLLENHPACVQIQAYYQAYVTKQWADWATAEKRRRKVIEIYGRLFEIKQMLEGSLAETQLELVWGIGVMVWRKPGIDLRYPLLTQSISIEINNSTMSLEIVPQDVDETLERECFVLGDNPGLLDLEKEFTTFVAHRATSLSPYDIGSFEGLLRSGAKLLDSKGIYWPDNTEAGDRTVPTASEELKVTDTWVLMARARGKSFFVQDLERFKNELHAENVERLPPAVDVILKKPADNCSPLHLPSFRGMSSVKGHCYDEDCDDVKPRELYFPLPFNGEQARIVQLLELYDGVVVQGPPGTGKTHTIANVIAHYLALGKRVLVTSMKEPALTVLRDKLPEKLRDFAVSLLTNEREGMKQFEASLGKMSSELQSINQVSMKSKIAGLELRLEQLHSNLTRIDRQIAEMAKASLSPISIDGDSITPAEAAFELMNGKGLYEWLDDNLTPTNQPTFDNADVARLRRARQLVGRDLCYLGLDIPQISLLPSTTEILSLHQKSLRFAALQRTVLEMGLFSPSNFPEQFVSKVDAIEELIGNYNALVTKCENFRSAWVQDVLFRLNSCGASLAPIIQIFEKVAGRLALALADRESFLNRPIFVPENLELNDDLMKAVSNLANNQRGLGWFGFWKRDVRKQLKAIRILQRVPQTAEEWTHVHGYLQLLLRSKELLGCWNSVAKELGVRCFATISPEWLSQAFECYQQYQDLRQCVGLRGEIHASVHGLFESANRCVDVLRDTQSYSRLLEALKIHCEYLELATVVIMKERLTSVLASCDGKIRLEIGISVTDKLGTEGVEGGSIASEWNYFLERIRQLHGLQEAFRDIEEVTERIEGSGASLWARKLRENPVVGVFDSLLPDNWQIAWRLKRLSAVFVGTSFRKILNEMASQRREVEDLLAKTYQDIVVQRAWLNLAARATPNIRSALQAYRAAIAKMGKGTGKRSARYRQDARRAAASAHSAIPCWIMPHWRVSESLPSKFGSFDLVVIDEASQSDLSALPALLRAQKILVVGDEKQVSPEAIGLEEEKIRNLMTRYLQNQIEDFRAQMTPDRSIYDLFKVAFPESSLMLREHFRCAGPIIEYSKREHYNHELQPVRLPKPSERLDPPLVDMFVVDGSRQCKCDVNLAEARVIVDEIKTISSDPRLRHRTIGVVSLLGASQAKKVWDMLEKEIGPEIIRQHDIACGDARTFQGKERDIVFLSMVVSPGNAQAQTKDLTAQRFNVAASRARDRMYLVRSIEANELSSRDVLRRRLIAHFAMPFEVGIRTVNELRASCESDFEREVYDFLTERGYRVVPQVKAGEYRIDMVVEGNNDALLAIECDGDRFHGPERWEEDMYRQRTLERMGWHFWRCFASEFVRNRNEVVQDLLQTLSLRGITPIGNDGRSHNEYTEHRRVTAFESSESLIDEASTRVADVGKCDETAT